MSLPDGVVREVLSKVRVDGLTWVLHVCVSDTRVDACAKDVELNEGSNEYKPLIFDSASNFHTACSFSFFVRNDFHVAIVLFRLG